VSFICLMSYMSFSTGIPFYDLIFFVGTSYVPKKYFASHSAS
jgi:hypothetical protein